jgi:tetratricopeptide (TPR) repeat protein
VNGGAEVGAPAVDHLRRGLDALRREEWDIALSALSAAVAADPQLAVGHAYLSGALLALGRPLEAQDAVEVALRLDPDGFASLLKAGELAMRLGDLDRAEIDFLAALRAAAPGSPESIVARRWLVLTRERDRRSIRGQAVLPRFMSRLRVGGPSG